uniref:Uncharacterized protein n=1 Tax=virus sp. ctx9V1 TaxID=2828001 RepID=A0A8S5RDM5_9VIRU|nr:MAG TPA: hypothetical protein [virus sp. ctx9V1]
MSILSKNDYARYSCSISLLESSITKSLNASLTYVLNYSQTSAAFVRSAISLALPTSISTSFSSASVIFFILY